MIYRYNQWERRRYVRIPYQDFLTFFKLQAAVLDPFSYFERLSKKEQQNLK